MTKSRFRLRGQAVACVVVLLAIMFVAVAPTAKAVERPEPRDGDVRSVSQFVEDVLGTQTASKRLAPAEGGAAGVIVPCPAGSLLENEPNCGDYLSNPPNDTVNGGCNSTPAVFTSIECGEAICGTAAQGSSFRDTDWYEVVTTEYTTFTWRATAAFRVVIGYVPTVPLGSGDCSTIGLLAPFAVGEPGEQATITTDCLPPGRHWFFVAPNTVDQVACPTPYVATLQCGEACATCNVGNGNSCFGPLPAFDGSNFGDLADNTGAVDETSCTFNDTIDEWYCYVATCGGLITATTCNSNTDYDSALAVFDACNGNELACNDDTVGAPPLCSLNDLNRKSTVTWSAEEGTQYLIRVSGFNGLVGEFELEILPGLSEPLIQNTETPNVAIPDNNAAGVFDDMFISANAIIVDIDVRVEIEHTFIGDLCCFLTHLPTNEHIVLFQRIGDGLDDCHEGGPLGCGLNNMNIVLSDEAATPIDTACANNLSGTFVPTESLDFFDGMTANGSWRLGVVDRAGGDVGTLVEWELIIRVQECGPCPQDCVTSATFMPPGDGVVDGADLAFLLGDWGPCANCCSDTISSATFAPPPDGVVDGADLAALLGAWGTPGCQ